ncbi:MAG: glutamate--tRNA ligase [bacterium]|nr:glutamate--tRNA ligase [bacterium]
MVRVRFAPSPTGYLHIGGARTALFNYLFARKNDGKFVLRIEDTDFERSNKEYEEVIMRDLKWLGLEWDEGPDVGGPYKPYRQSERLDLYKEYANKLIQEGKAYYCYCTEEELEVQRKLQLKEKKPPIYDRRCLNLTDKKRQEYINEGRKPSVRFLVPYKELEITDLIHGKLSIDTKIISDPIILKSNGVPTYNFGVVIDDHFMEITHVIRGDEHLDNTYRQVLIYEALDWQIPFYAHIPMILAPDRSKLSKRHGATSVEELKKLGFINKAVINYIALLGWSPKDNTEIMFLDQIVSKFDLSGVLDHPAVYDIEKMKYFNHYYIANILSDSEILENLNQLLAISNLGYNLDDDLKLKVIKLEKNRVYLLTDFFELFDIIENDPEIKEDVLNELKSIDRNVFEVIINSLNDFEYYDDMEKIKGYLKDVSKRSNIKVGQLYKSIRLLLTGKSEGPELPKIIYLLGKEKTIKRINVVKQFV